MDHQHDFLVFISYSRSDTALKKSVESTIRERCNVNVWVDSTAILPGEAIHANIEEGLKKSDCVLAILTRNSVKSLEVREELTRAHEREISILVLKDSKVPPGSLPHFLRDKRFIEYDQRDLEHSLRDVSDRITEMVKTKVALATKDVTGRCGKPVEEANDSGIVSPKDLETSRNRMSNEVFAIELLTQPVKLERDETGSVVVTVDRHDVKEMLISNEAKLAKTKQYVTPEKKSRLLELDRQIQTFLAGRGSRGTMSINLPELDIRLRWASGGVLSIVTDAQGKKWVPLFFRDIRPYGWNIALGTTERWFDTLGCLDTSYNLNADLINPRTFILREFLEESIVVTPDPQTPGTLIHKRFKFLNDKPQFSESQANEFYEKYSRVRADEHDEVTIREENGLTTDVTFEKTNCSLKVLSNSPAEVTSDVLICFSLLDLGIEVVRVAKYNFDEGDWMLDGEIWEKHVADTGATERKLIRMPVAMLSLKYLRETFGANEDWHCYTFGPQPSIKVPRAPIPNEQIRLYEPDVERRMKAVEGEWGDKWHRDRFVDWYDKFGSHFIKDREFPHDKWQVSNTNPSRLFVPGTAKILNLYFDTVEGKEKSEL